MFDIGNISTSSFSGILFFNLELTYDPTKLELVILFHWYQHFPIRDKKNFLCSLSYVYIALIEN